jgi:hypothetical protein
MPLPRTIDIDGDRYEAPGLCTLLSGAGGHPPVLPDKQ